MKIAGVDAGVHIQGPKNRRLVDAVVDVDCR